VILVFVMSALAGQVGALGATPDYPGATWVPANPANYTVANRPHDYPVDMIVIHDIEGSAPTAIQIFQDPTRQASAHYVISGGGAVTQMVQEKDIAWHAGNWDYNTRSIGIEHAGYAWTPGTFTDAEYQASAHLAASICERWGVPMDRQHVIGHNEVPDPNNPGLYGGSSHHTDPGPYWNWSYYMSLAAGYANALPSRPHMVLSASALPSNQSATLSWPAARSCHLPVSSYHIVGQPGDIAVDVPGTTTSTTVTGLQNGVTYAFTVTAINADGQDSLSTNAVTPYTSPGAPSNVVATPGEGSVALSWTRPADGGNPIFAYRVTPFANGVAQTPVMFARTNTAEVISGLTNGVTYTFVVVAINAAGPGAASAVSNAVTPSWDLHPGAQQAAPAPSPSPEAAAQSSPAPIPSSR
jgi:hypothetical protein